MNKFLTIIVFCVLIVNSADALKKKKKKLLLGGVVVGGLAKLKLATVAGLAGGIGGKGKGFGHDQPSHSSGYSNYGGGTYGNGGYGTIGFGLPYNSAYLFGGHAFNPTYSAFSPPNHYGHSKQIYQSYYPIKSTQGNSRCNPCAYKDKSPLYAGGWK